MRGVEAHKGLPGAMPGAYPATRRAEGGKWREQAPATSSRAACHGPRLKAEFRAWVKGLSCKRGTGLPGQRDK